MKLKMLVGLSGNEYSLSPGDERDFPGEYVDGRVNGEAGRLIDAGYAVAAAPEKPAKTDKPEGETDVVSRKGGDAAKRRAGKSAGSEAPGEI